MKKTLILLLILIIAGGVYYFLIQGDNSGTINLENRDFIVENPDDIAFITVKTKAYPMMHLEKKSKDQWILNKKYVADKNVVSNMVGTLSKMEIKYIPTKATNANIIKNLDRVGIEITTYDKRGNVLKELVMGSNDNKEGATFCVRKGYDQSYAMHLRVTEGGLRNYFDQTQLNLRDKSVFNIDHADIKSLSISYMKDKKSSFKITKDNEGFDVEAIGQFNPKQVDVNDNIVDAYLKDYSQIYSEAIRTGDITMDSIKQFVPFAKIEFELKDASKQSFDFYPMLDLVDNEVSTQKINDLAKIDRHFVFSNTNEVYVVQQRMVKEFFKPITYFYQ